VGVGGGGMGESFLAAGGNGALGWGCSVGWVETVGQVECAWVWLFDDTARSAGVATGNLTLCVCAAAAAALCR
jgi:hypothetical protein